MTTGYMLRFLENLPFEPFSVFASDGREIRIMHPEMAAAGRGVMTLNIFHEEGQVEVVDLSFITSLRTVRASTTSFDEQPLAEQ